MEQFAFVFDDVKRRKLYYLRFFVQILVVLLVIGLCASLLLSLSSFLSRFSIFDDLSKTYICRVQTNDDVYSNRTGQARFINRLLELNSFISHSDDIELAAYSLGTFICQ